MTTTVTALYDDWATAEKVVQELVNAGFARDRISIVANDASGEYSRSLGTLESDDDVKGNEGAGFGAVTGALIGLGAMLIPGIGPVIAAGPLVAGLIGAGVGAAAGAVTGGITASLVKLGMDEELAGAYAEGVRRGGVLVAVQADDNKAKQAQNIMNRFPAIDVTTRASDWKAGGWSGFADDSEGLSADEIRAERQRYSGDGNEKLEVVEEELQVGKREVERGGVRAHTVVTETPVEEQVRLREEHVVVERHPVNRPATDADFATGEQQLEVTEMVEEPVVTKKARVVEEVVIGKQAQERTETVRDTVRRKDVNVEQVGTSTPAFETYNTDFRTHYNNAYGSSGRAYDYYSPAYRYGYTLATDPTYRDYDWNRLETEARRGWERDNDSLWDDVKDAVRHSWNKVRNALD